MSMIMTLKQAPQETLDLLLQRPELAIVFWMDPDYVPPKQPAWVRWIARTLGGYSPPMELPEPPPNLARNGQICDLDKSWHGLHWLLTQPKSVEPGDDWDIGPPEGFLLTAGQLIEGTDHGYGDERAVSPDEVSAFSELLTRTPWHELESRIDPEQLSASSVYPNHWDNSSETEYLRSFDAALRGFIQETAAETLGVVIQLS